jgi:hypothetical protein
MSKELKPVSFLPAWLPETVRLYLDHTEDGVSFRELARREGCHASTILRIVRRFETRRDDPLLDEALSALVKTNTAPSPPPRLTRRMTVTCLPPCAIRPPQLTKR